MRATRWMLAVLAWATCVGAVATVAWYAIDSAGRQVTLLSIRDSSVAISRPGSAPGAGRPSVSVSSSATVASSTAAPTPEPTVGTGASTSRPASSPTRAPRTDTPSASDGTTPATGSDSSEQPASPSPTVTPSPEVIVRTRAFSTRGGVVTVICRTPGEIDFAVRPAQGWSANGDKIDSRTAEIQLTRDRDAIAVHAWCRNGEPRAEIDGGDGDDED